MNKLLERQIKKLLPEDHRSKPELLEFISAISDSYDAFERDIELSERAFRITEEEYHELYGKLNNEIELKKQSIHKLRTAVAEIGSGVMESGNDEDELLSIASHLKEQIAIRTETENRLNEQKKFYEQILNEMPADIAVFDKDHRYMFLNPIAIKDDELRKWMIGKSDEEFCIYRNKPLAVAEGRRALFNSVVGSKQQKSWVEQLKNRNGQTEYHLRKMYPVFNDQGELQMVIGYGADITESKKNEEKVRQSEARYRSIFDNSLAVICTHDMDGKLLEVNKAAEITLGYPLSALAGTPIAQLLPPERRQEFDAAYMAAIKEHGKAEGIMIAKSKSGRDVYLLYQNFLVSHVNETPYVISFSQDITARIDAEKALKKSEEKYRGIIENMNLGMIQVNKEDQIVYANETFCKMSGYSLDEITGRRSVSLLLNDKNGDIVRTANDRRKSGQSDAYEIELKNKNGETMWWMVSGAPLIDNMGVFQGTIGVNLDITRQKKMEMELRHAKAEAEHSARSKEIFLANMSHEIRTPMNAIIGIGRLLAKTSLEEQQKYYLDLIQSASNNLLIIINDLLDFSKIDSGKMVLERIGFNLPTLIGNTMSMLAHRAEEKNLLMNADYGQGLTEVLIGDPHRLNQVLINLLGNSIKFTEQGEIKVSCSLKSGDDHQQTILFQVSDTGIGMGPEFLEHLFEKFTQEDESITRKFGGTGLGMSISKQLIELMGGTIEVSSEKNVGTAISFTIPFAIGTKEDLPGTWNTNTDTQALKGKKILLVEDNHMNRVLANTILEQYGAEVTNAEDGSVAIEKVTDNKFDLILMDLQMPVKNGIETTEYIRTHLDKSTPIIALTANALKKEEEQCLASGMNDYMSKPFDEDDLIQLMAQWLGNEATIASGAPAPITAINKELYDLTKLRAICRGDEIFVRRMQDIFKEEIPVSVAEMEAALKAKDWQALAATAHKIKPSVHSFGIQSLAEDLELLECVQSEDMDKDRCDKVFRHVKNVLSEVVAKF